MDLTYKIIGADGNEYGPVTLEQLRSWVGDSRVTAATQVIRSDQTAWSTAAQFPELNVQGHPSPVAPSPSGSFPASHDPARASAASLAASPEMEHLHKHMRSGASWFYWIAGLSLINSIMALSGKGWGFILGLGMTQVIDGAASNLGSNGLVVAIVLDVLVAGLFVLFGVFANRGHLWSFIVGMIFYAADGLIFLIAQDWLGLGFHAFVLFCLFGGLRAARQLKPLIRPA